MGRKRNKKTAEPTLSSILNSDSNSNTDNRSIEKGSCQSPGFKDCGRKLSSWSRKPTTVKENGTTPLADIHINDVISTRLRSRGKKSVDEIVENEAHGENPSKRSSRRIESKNVEGTGNKENVKPSEPVVVVEDATCAKDGSAMKRKRATKRRSVAEGTQMRRSKRNRVQSSTMAGSTMAKKEENDDGCLRKQLIKEFETKVASDPLPQRSLSPGTGADAVETGSNSVPNTPGMKVLADVLVISDDEDDNGNQNVSGIKNRSLQKCQNKDDDEHSTAITMVEMQKLYSKLHAKYQKLKASKFDDVAVYVGEQNNKFGAYVRVAEELLEHLRNDNNRLRSEANESAALNRTRLLEHQNDLLVEQSKNLALLKEVKRLEQLLSKQENMNKQALNMNLLCQDASTQSFCFTEKSVVLQPEICEPIVDISCIGSEEFSKNGSSSFKEAMVQTEMIQNICHNCCLESRVTLEEPASGLLFNEAARGGACTFNQGDKPVSEDTLKGEARTIGCSRANSLFQMLFQCMLGLHFSIVNERTDLELLVYHESSGFSFKLKCLSAEDDPKLRENGELLYRSVSLGTLQKIAPGWMKEEIIFNTGQINIFFDRILQVANGREHNLLVG